MVLPARNGPDLEDVPEAVRDEMTFHLAADIGEVLDGRAGRSGGRRPAATVGGPTRQQARRLSGGRSRRPVRPAGHAR